jgi:plasmid maintenance system antidote protein VapI
VNDQFRICFRWAGSDAENVEIVAGKRAITADTDLRLCRFFGLSDGWWLRLQADHDTEVAKATLAKTLAKIRPWKGAREQTADVP